MFWIFLLLILMMAVSCYVLYMEAGHHELHEVLEKLDELHQKHVELLNEAKENDPEMKEYFTGELMGIDEAYEVVKGKYSDHDTIQEMEYDLARLKERVAAIFGNKKSE